MWSFAVVGRRRSPQTLRHSRSQVCASVSPANKYPRWRVLVHAHLRSSSHASRNILTGVVIAADLRSARLFHPFRSRRQLNISVSLCLSGRLFSATDGHVGWDLRLHTKCRSSPGFGGQRQRRSIFSSATKRFKNLSMSPQRAVPVAHAEFAPSPAVPLQYLTRDRRYITARAGDNGCKIKV